MKEFEKRVIRRLSAEHHFAPDDESAIWLDNTMETYKNFMMVSQASTSSSGSSAWGRCWPASSA